MIVYSVFSILVPIVLILISKFPSSMSGKIYAIFSLENIFYFIMFGLCIYFFLKNIYFGWVTAITPSMLVILFSTILLVNGVRQADPLTIMIAISNILIQILMTTYFAVNLGSDIKAISKEDIEEPQDIGTFGIVFIIASAIYLSQIIIPFWKFIGVQGMMILQGYALQIFIIVIFYIGTIILWTRHPNNTDN